jgi:hypothetical protein
MTRRCVPRPSALLALVALSLVAAAPAAARQADEMSEAEYRRWAADARAAVDRSRLSDAEVQELARRIRPVKRIRLADGTTLTVDLKRDADVLQSLVGRAAAPGPAPADVRDRFTALSEVVTGQAPAKPATPDPTLQAAAILKEKQFEREPEFVGKDLPWTEQVRKWVRDVVDAALRSLGRFLRWLFGRWTLNPNLPRLQGVGDVILLIIYFLAAVAACIGLYYLGRFGWTAYQRRSGRFKDEPGGPTGLDLSEEGVDDPLSAAHEMAQQGEYRSAIRYAYIASLQRLEGAGLLVLEKNRTNWEYQRELRAVDHRAHEALLPATRLFDRVWYGRRAGTREEYEAVVGVYNALRSAAPPAPDTTGQGPAARNGDKGNTW